MSSVFDEDIQAVMDFEAELFSSVGGDKVESNADSFTLLEPTFTDALCRQLQPVKGCYGAKDDVIVDNDGELLMFMSSSAFDAQDLKDFESELRMSSAGENVESIADTTTSLEPAFIDVSCCEIQPVKDFFDTEDANLVFDNAGAVLNSISNDPLFQSKMNDPRLSLELERSKWVSDLIYHFQGKDTEDVEIENDYSSISNEPLFLQWMMNDPKLLSLDSNRSKSAPDLIDFK
jgi:hypothetical protein